MSSSSKSHWYASSILIFQISSAFQFTWPRFLVSWSPLFAHQVLYWPIER
jgi:hypothetical protein